PIRKEKPREDIFEKLSKTAGVKLKEQSISDLREMTAKKKTTEEITDMFVGLSKKKEFTVEVFQTVLKELINTGKISGSDVKKVGIDLMVKGVISKEQLARIFFNLGIKR
ncbi:hypothetical protein KY339_02420, partial [Candidatus Woesearchaeota archaeon]|nr:hypothetical protein [Candidatus Woesearchaeota archaeon]